MLNAVDNSVYNPILASLEDINRTVDKIMGAWNYTWNMSNPKYLKYIAIIEKVQSQLADYHDEIQNLTSLTNSKYYKSISDALKLIKILKLGFLR